MTWTSPSTRVTGERITQSIWNTDLVENLRYLYNTLIVGLPPSCRVWRSTNQAITLNTDTPLSFDTEIFDTDTMFDPASPTKITFKTAGKYLVGGCIDWAASVGGQARNLWIRRNAGNTLVRQLVSTDAGGGDAILVVATVYLFSAGDYIELYCRSVASIDVVSTAEYSPIFWAMRLGL